MVASSNTEIYSPFQPPIISEEGPQSSEEGSSLHSPVAGALYPTHGDSFRYQHDQLDVHPSPAMIASPFDYAHNLSSQQPPILDTALEPPNSTARHVTFPNPYTLPPRNQLGLDFPSQSPLDSRLPPLPLQEGSPVDFRYNPTTERRLPSGSSHDHSYPRTTASTSVSPMDSDHRPTFMPSAARSEPHQGSPEASTRGTRKESSAVVIACRQCRSRKIRCDSTRPVCNNCTRRSNECEYDLVPKRRGPDKRPGTRQRSCKKRPTDGSAPPPKRKRTTTITTTDRSSSNSAATEHRELPQSKVKENMSNGRRPSPHLRHPDRQQHDSHYPNIHPQSALPSPNDLRISDPTAHYKHEQFPHQDRRTSPYSAYEQGLYTKSTYPRQLDVNTFQFPDTHRKFPIPTSPTVATDQRNWWDKILRSHTLNEIASEITFLVHNTSHLLSFINLNFLVKRLLREEERLQIQPSFILACLAMVKLMKSSTVEGGSIGLQTAMMLASDARSAFEDSMRNRWLDCHLAEAALILALFESSAYPHHSPNRAASALITLDNLIRTIALSNIDAGDSDVCLFRPHTVPMVLVDSGLDDPVLDRKCACFPPDAIEPSQYSNQPHVLPWDPNWTPEEIRDEEIRRLCWSALSLISEYVAHCEVFNEDIPRFSLCEPSNFGILFPGEVIDRASPNYHTSESLSPKESVWALYCRSMLLWNFCNRFRQPSEDEERAEQAHEAFLEVQSIEDSLNAHRCNLDTTLIYTCREYIHNTRMLVTQAIRSFHGIEGRRSTSGPMFKRKQAEDWLFYQDQVIRRVIPVVHQLNSTVGRQLTQRPFRLNWFVSQLAICFALWSRDPTLIDALKLAKNILVPIDAMNALWPCPAIEQRCNSLRQQISEACSTTGIELPFRADYSASSYLRS